MYLGHHQHAMSNTTNNRGSNNDGDHVRSHQPQAVSSSTRPTLVPSYPNDPWDAQRRFVEIRKCDGEENEPRLTAKELSKLVKGTRLDVACFDDQTIFKCRACYHYIEGSSISRHLTGCRAMPVYREWHDSPYRVHIEKYGDRFYKEKLPPLEDGQKREPKRNAKRIVLFKDMRMFKHPPGCVQVAKIPEEIMKMDGVDRTRDVDEEKLATDNAAGAHIEEIEHVATKSFRDIVGSDKVSASAVSPGKTNSISSNLSDSHTDCKTSDENKEVGNEKCDGKVSVPSVSPAELRSSLSNRSDQSIIASAKGDAAIDQHTALLPRAEYLKAGDLDAVSEAKLPKDLTEKLQNDVTHRPKDNCLPKCPLRMDPLKWYSCGVGRYPCPDYIPEAQWDSSKGCLRKGTELGKDGRPKCVDEDDWDFNLCDLKRIMSDFDTRVEDKETQHTKDVAPPYCPVKMDPIKWYSQAPHHYPCPDYIPELEWDSSAGSLRKETKLGKHGRPKCVDAQYWDFNVGDLKRIQKYKYVESLPETEFEGPPRPVNYHTDWGPPEYKAPEYVKKSDWDEASGCLKTAGQGEGPPFAEKTDYLESFFDKNTGDVKREPKLYLFLDEKALQPDTKKTEDKAAGVSETRKRLALQSPSSTQEKKHKTEPTGTVFLV